ncbi:MAG TPA: SURF1 family protein [Actinomycetota bacterium]|nr:SURF1 family protein [Actinomycetota bacterium]
MVERSLFRGRLLVGHLLVVAVATLFVRLGFWQLDRLAEVRARNALIESRLEAPPRPVEHLMGPGGQGADRARFRRAVAEGRYDLGAQVVVPFRTREGRPGHFLLAPLVTSSGTELLVNRGWVPLSTEAEERLQDVARAFPPPRGVVRVLGVLLPPEPGGPPPRREGPVVEAPRIDVPALRTLTGRPMYPLYLQLEAQRPLQGPFPAPVPLPARSEGPHLSYAIQWFLFATIAVVGWGLFLRRALGRRPTGAVAGAGPGDRSPS